MTPLDAARLLTALLAAPRSVAAEDTVTAYGNAYAIGFSAGSRPYAGSRIPALEQLPTNHSFIDAVAALLSAEMNYEERQAPDNRIEVSASSYSVRGFVAIQLQTGKWANVEYSEVRPARETEPSDLEQVRRITRSTLSAVGKLFHIEGAHRRSV